MFYIENQGFVHFTIEQLRDALANFPDDYRIDPFIHADSV